MCDNTLIAMIPARIGSTRLPMKNLALLAGRPLVSYALNAAKNSGAFSKIILNGDHEVFRQIAKEYETEFYLRPPKLGASDVKSDDVVMDFIQKNPCDIVAWINSIAPLQKPEEIRNIASYFISNKLDSLFTLEERQVHALINNNPINFTTKSKFSQTQDLTPISLYSYSVMMWRCDSFTKSMKDTGTGFYTGKIGHYKISRQSSIIVKTEEDLLLVEAIFNSQNHKIRYHKSASKIKIGDFS